LARKTKRAALVLTEEQRRELASLAGSRTASKREIERAGMLLLFAEGRSILQIRNVLGVSRPTIYKCIDKALAAGVAAGLSDTYHRPKSPEIGDDAKSWVVGLACTKPKDHGLAAELWTLSQLAKFIGEQCEAAGFSRLAKASKTTVWRILDGHKIKPHRIRYYLERRDPDFDAKMREVLMVYQEVSLQNAMPTKASADASELAPTVITVSVDGKPGIQAIATVAPDLPPVAGRHAETGRDYEYVRHGTLSILAALDLHDGHIIAEVKERHRSCEFIQLLKQLDEHYPADATIRVILDNHSSHISKETMAYLATRPGRFDYVHTPKHGSWLNLIEMAFSKMARSFLRHIRVTSKQELKERILKGIAEFNNQPVVFKWKKFNLDLV
jgi:transposase